MCYNIHAMKEDGYISLKSMTREQRDALREAFLRAYARSGKVAENARTNCSFIHETIEVYATATRKKV